MGNPAFYIIITCLAEWLTEWGHILILCVWENRSEINRYCKAANSLTKTKIISIQQHTDPRTEGTLANICFYLFFNFPRRTYWFDYHLDLSLLENKVWDNNNASSTGMSQQWALLSVWMSAMRLRWERMYLSSLARIPLRCLQKGGHLSFSSVSKNNKLSLSSLFACDQRSVLAEAVTGEGPIRGLRPPRGLILYSVFWGVSCQALPCALKSLATLWHVTLGL